MADLAKLKKKLHLTDWAYYGNTNVCLVDYMNIATLPYLKAIIKTNIIAEQVSTFIWSLIKQLNMNTYRISVAGHSLGAQISGGIGRFVWQNFHYPIGTIFGEQVSGALI